MGTELIDENNTGTQPELEMQYLHGWRLYTMAVSLLLSLFLVNVEGTIMSTSLFAITSDLGSFTQTSWIITSYLITYTGFIVLWTRVCGIWGWRNTYLTAMGIFLAFSLGCALSKTGTQLIICRAFQGLGGGGTYSLVMLCVYQLVPKAKFATFSGLISITIALATITGPVIGGALGRNSAWRWLFYLNLPPGCVAMLIAVISMPPHFSKGPKILHSSTKSWFLLMWRIDLPGMFFLLGGSLMLVTILDETNSHISWSSASAIVLIIMSAAFWAAFFAWEILISSKEPHIKPVFPKRFFSNWPLIGIFLTSFIVGIPYNSIIVYLPQRFQALLGDSALMAGIRLLGYSGVTAFSSTIAIVISTRLGIPFLPILLTGAVLNLVGIVLLSTLPTSNVFPAAGYGYEVIAGCGMGIAYGISIFSVPYLLSPKDLQEGSGVVVQMRYLGSSLGVSISSNIFNGRLKSGVSQLIPKDAYEKLLHNVESLSSLPPNIRSRVQDNFSESYRIQFQVLIGFAVAQLAVAFLLIRKGKQIRPSELATH